jgi:hypothetical protein
MSAAHLWNGDRRAPSRKEEGKLDQTANTRAADAVKAIDEVLGTEAKR